MRLSDGGTARAAAWLLGALQASSLLLCAQAVPPPGSINRRNAPASAPLLVLDNARSDPQQPAPHMLLAPVPGTTTDPTTPRLPDVWEALGPFPHGSRETGVDPLSAYGGFERLVYNEDDRYPSELADGGWVTWRRVQTNADGSVGPLDYPNVRWDFNRQSFGWTVLHHATYFRGTFKVATAGSYLVSLSSVVSFKIDDRAFVGNVYSYDHASESAVYLEAGEHSIYVCSFMDVRLFGGSVPPKTSFTGVFRAVDVDGPQLGLVSFPRDTLLPELMGDHLITPYGTVTIMNADMSHQSRVPPGDDAPAAGRRVHRKRGVADDEVDEEEEDEDEEEEQESGEDKTVGGEDGKRGGGRNQGGQPGKPDGTGWIRVLGVRAVPGTDTDPSDHHEYQISIPTSYTIKLAPGQVAPIPFQFEGPTADNVSDTVTLSVLVQQIDTGRLISILVGSFRLKRRTWGDVYRMTFVGYDQSIQYAMVRPPKKPCVRSAKMGCPIVVALHGAGVETDSPFWVDSIKQQDHGWVVYPTGRTPWGFDWHGSSAANVEASLDTLQQLSPGVPEDVVASIRATASRRIYVGHSNGGQGAWWMMTHYPDTAIAAIPVSGYVKIQHYIPYYMHIGDAYADPMLRAILESSIAENDLDLYVPNAVGIPLLARTGGDDDNVPPLHTRRLVRIVNEWSRNPMLAQVSEVPGKGHWFDGVLTDPIVQEFLDKHLDPTLNANLDLPQLPEAFTIQTLNPGSTGSKGGIRILQLQVPFRLGTIRVHRYGDKWVLNTTNVRRFGFIRDDRQNDIQSWSIDGTDFSTPPSDSGPSYLKTGKQWELYSDLLWISRERHPSTYGPAPSIFSQPLRIVIPSTSHANQTLYRQLAQHIASSWYLASRGGTQIIRDVDVLDGLSAQYNMIVLGGPTDNLYTRRRESQGASGLVRFLPSGGVAISDRTYELPGTGILFLAPSPTRTRLGLFVAGVDADGLRRAVWTIPFRTGLQVPDYMVVGDEYGDPATGWTAGDGAPFGGGGTKGAGGVFAAGYWNNTWDFDDRCGYLK